MFNLQPGCGLGFTASKQIAFGLGSSFVLREIILKSIISFTREIITRSFIVTKTKQSFTRKAV